VGGFWATKSKGVGLIDRAISFQDFQPTWSWSTNVTDGRTDGRTCNCNITIWTIAHRAVKTNQVILLNLKPTRYKVNTKHCILKQSAQCL